MLNRDNPWQSEVKKTNSRIKFFLSDLGIFVRNEQHRKFISIIRPNSRMKILDVGVSSHDIFKNENMFEKLFPYLENVVAATIENSQKIKRRYPKLKKVVKVEPGHKLPFRNKEFDVVVSWATLEHVGSLKDQRYFLSEMNRIGKRIFLTTPYRGCFYEPHSGFFFLHWLPLPIFRDICRISGKSFWSQESNLNPLFIKDVLRIRPNSKVKVVVYKMFGIIPSHLLIYA